MQNEATKQKRPGLHKTGHGLRALEGVALQCDVLDSEGVQGSLKAGTLRTKGSTGLHSQITTR